MSNNKTLQSIGLALSGGAWRGPAHVGVLEVFEERSLKIDFLAGTSIGAFVGGLYAYFGATKPLLEIIDSLSYKKMFELLFDPALNTALSKGERLEQYLEDLTHGASIESLKIPFAAVATDLQNGEPVYIRSGSLAEAIRASISIPVIFAPVVTSTKQVLIDGVMSEPVPVGALKAMGAQKIIAVNLYNNLFPVNFTSLSENQSPFTVARLSEQLLLHRLAEINCQLADGVINPAMPEEKFDLFLKFMEAESSIKLGREAATTFFT